MTSLGNLCFTPSFFYRTNVLQHPRRNQGFAPRILAMTTIADDLLNDFASSGDEADEVENNNGLKDFEDSESEDGDAMEVDGRDGKPKDGLDGRDAGADDAGDTEAKKAKVEKMQLGAVKDVRSVASLMQTLEPILEKIAYFKSQSETQTSIIGNIEDHPEYHLLTQSNSLSTQIDGEVAVVHKFIRDHYSTRFPELERLVTTPLEYAKVVSILGNGPLDADNIKTLQTATTNPLGVGLKAVLDGPSLMIVTVEATTSKGREMAADEIERVYRACDMVISLHKAKNTLTEYVQSRMSIFAPNLTTLIGSLTAAQLLNVAGGLTGLSKTPACNIASMGSKKRQAGLATNIGIRQQGYLYHSEIIRGIPNDLKKQAMRIVSAKLVLAARVDRVHSSPDGSTGEELKQACLDRLEKLTEPPPNKGQRALPIPDDKPARKRGGRRARKAKEALAMTDLRKAQNRVAFGKEEIEVGYGTGSGTVGMGMIGQGNDGKIRGMQVDNRTRAKLSAKNKGWGQPALWGRRLVHRRVRPGLWHRSPRQGSAKLGRREHHRIWGRHGLLAGVHPRPGPRARRPQDAGGAQQEAQSGGGQVVQGRHLHPSGRLII
uniref:Nop domain-containing protein n=1 Tax=Bionectria ochroleuca TaxID=29856 RepID=A0A8H7TQK8_BIOOC